MKKSDGLSERLENNVKNEDSKGQEKTIKVVVSWVLAGLKVKYPKYKFGIQKRMSLREIQDIYKPGKYQTSEKSYITPDGWFLWVEINNAKYYILVSEQKYQGSNDKRILNGKGKQGMGNAVERLGKNVLAVEMLFTNEKINPFVVFLQGCDFFDPESRIGDRVRTIAKFQDFNEINLFKTEENRMVGGSYYMRGHSMNDLPGTSDWTIDEMKEVMFTIADKSVTYYIEKYG